MIWYNFKSDFILFGNCQVVHFIKQLWLYFFYVNIPCYYYLIDVVPLDIQFSLFMK